MLSTLQLYSLCSKLLTFISLHFCSFSIFHSLVSELLTTISFINEWIIGNERKCKKWMFRVWSPGMRQKKCYKALYPPARAEWLRWALLLILNCLSRGILQKVCRQLSQSCRGHLIFAFYPTEYEDKRRGIKKKSKFYPRLINVYILYIIHTL